MTWYLFAIFAAACWGVNYVMVGKLLPTLSIYTLYILPLCISVLYLPFSNFMNDVKTIAYSEMYVKIYVIVAIVSSIFANIFLYKSFKESDNVVLSSLIEISYPLFVCVFSYLFFKEFEMNSQTMLGGMCIIVGAVIIISNH